MHSPIAHASLRAGPERTRRRCPRGRPFGWTLRLTVEGIEWASAPIPSGHLRPRVPAIPLSPAYREPTNAASRSVLVANAGAPTLVFRALRSGDAAVGSGGVPIRDSELGPQGGRLGCCSLCTSIVRLSYVSRCARRNFKPNHVIRCIAVGAD